MWQAALSLQRALFHTNGQHLMGKKKKERRQDCDGILESSTKVALLILNLFFVLWMCSFGMVCGVACVACCSTVYHSLGIFRIVARGKQSCGGGSGSVQHTAAAVGHKDHQKPTATTTMGQHPTTHHHTHQTHPTHPTQPTQPTQPTHSTTNTTTRRDHDPHATSVGSPPQSRGVVRRIAALRAVGLVVKRGTHDIGRRRSGTRTNFYCFFP
jgi:hypothetical protein